MPLSEPGHRALWCQHAEKAVGISWVPLWLGGSHVHTQSSGQGFAVPAEDGEVGSLLLSTFWENGILSVQQLQKYFGCFVIKCVIGLSELVTLPLTPGLASLCLSQPFSQMPHEWLELRTARLTSNFLCVP